MISPWVITIQKSNNENEASILSFKTTMVVIFFQNKYFKTQKKLSSFYFFLYDVMLYRN